MINNFVARHPQNSSGNAHLYSAKIFFAANVMRTARKMRGSLRQNTGHDPISKAANRPVKSDDTSLHMKNAGYGPIREGIKHPLNTDTPSFNNYTDALHYYFEDERRFSMVSRQNFANKGDSIEISADDKIIAFHNYINNSGKDAVIGAMIYADAFYRNFAGDYVTRPFDDSLIVTHHIKSANSKPGVTWDTSMVTSKNKSMLRLRYRSCSSCMWIWSPAGSRYHFASQESQASLFSGGINVGGSEAPFSGIFEPGDNLSKNTPDRRVEFQYYVYVESAIADLSAKITLDGHEKRVNDTIKYTIDINNGGPIESLGVIMLHDYDEKKVLINKGSLPASCHDSGEHVKCFLKGELPPSKGAQITYMATAASLGASSNIVKVFSNATEDLVAGNNSSAETVTIIE